MTVMTRSWLVMRVRSILALESGYMSFSSTMYVVGSRLAETNNTM